MLHTKKIVSALTLMVIASNMTFAETGSGASGTGTATTGTTLEMKSGPTLKSKTDTTVTLEWEKLPAAASYIIKFSKKSVASSTDPNAQYDNETDPIIENTFKVENLTPATTYYFSIVAVDKNNIESDNLSDELVVTTNPSGAAITSSTGATVDTTANTATKNTATPETTTTKAGLTLVDVKVEDNKTIHLNFSAPLNKDPIEVRITNNLNGMDIPVSKEAITIDPSSPARAIVKVTTVLDPKTSYSVTVITAKDINGNNVEKGVNGTKEFQTPVFAATPAANNVTNTSTNSTGGLSTGTGTTGTGSNINVTNTKALPATGTKENIIILVALMLSLGIFVGVKKIHQNKY